MSVSLLQSAFAILLLVLTPQQFLHQVAKYVPGTVEYVDMQQQYMRKVRDITANRVDKFSSVFAALSTSFAKLDEVGELDEERELDLFLSKVTETTCETCHRKMYCWSKNFTETYSLFGDLVYEVGNNLPNLCPELKRDWQRYCLKAKTVIDKIEEELVVQEVERELKKQVRESRRLVAEQLQGVSEVMEDFAAEIKKERIANELQENRVKAAFAEFGYEINNLEIFNLERGNVDIDVTLPCCYDYGECEKIVAPLLSNILDETIVANKGPCPKQVQTSCTVNFRSTQKYKITTGVAHAAKGGGLVSGDSYTTIDISSGKFALAISDGMGNGERAFQESNETLRLLQKILQSGIAEKVAIKSINSILALRTTDEIFTTLDLALIDLQDARGKFLKISAMPSFIKRADQVMQIEDNSLPIGIVADLDVEVINTPFKVDDLLIMVSDGVFAHSKTIKNNEFWLRRKISEIETKEPQAVADLIIEEVIRSREGKIYDDITVLVAKIDHNIPKWAPISVNSLKSNLSS